MRRKVSVAGPKAQLAAVGKLCSPFDLHICLHPVVPKLCFYSRNMLNQIHLADQLKTPSC